MKVHTKLYPFLIICLFLISLTSILANYKSDDPIKVLGVNLAFLRGESQLQRNNSIRFQPIPRLMNNTSISNLNGDQENNSFRYSSKIHESYSLPSWGGIGFEYRKNITIDSSKVSADLTSFPLLIDLRDATDIFGATQPSGDDIIFTDIGGSKLDHELELFDRETSHLVAWVRLPSLSSSIDTQISIYYGNNTVGNQQNPTGVWNNNYMAVWHLTGDPSNTIIDSTSNNNDGIAFGTVQREEGVIGYGYNFDQSESVNDYLQIAQSSSLSLTGNQMTLEGWIYLPYTPVPYNSMIFDKAGINYDSEGYMMGVDGDWIGGGEGYPTRLNRRLNTDITGNITRDDGQIYPGKWTYVAAVYNGTQSFFAGYIDAINAHSESVSGNIINSNMDLFIARRDEPQERMFYGSMDELRISNVSRSPGYLTTVFNNYNDPNSFYSIGLQEPFRLPFFKHRQDLTIDASMVSGNSDLTNFSLLLDLYPKDLSGGIMFVNETTLQPFDYEIELYEPSSGSTPGHLVAWVRLPVFSATKDTEISLYYGNSASPSDNNPDNLWFDYMGVWHLGEPVEDEENSPFIHIDETLNENNGNQTGNDDYEGIIGKSQDFDGIDDHIKIGDPDNLDLIGLSNYTISGWFYRDTTTTTDVIIDKFYLESPDYTGYSLWIDSSDGLLHFIVADDDDDGVHFKSSSNFNSLPTGWYSFNINFDTGINTLPTEWSLYINGINDNGATSSYGTGDQNPEDFSTSNNQADLTIGAHANNTNHFDGKLDEIRIIQKQLSEDWIRTEYINQYNLSAYLTIGSEENTNWWSAESFGFRKDLKIDHTQFEGIEEDFILWPGAKGYIGDQGSDYFRTSTDTYNYEAVDERVTDDGSTYMYLSYNNTFRSEYFYPVGIPRSCDGAITKVTLVSRARRSGFVISSNFQYYFRMGGSDQYVGERTLGTTYSTHYEEETINPFTGESWTWEDLDSLQFGIRARVTYGSTVRRIDVTQFYAIVSFINNKSLYDTPFLVDIRDKDLKTDVQANGNDLKFIDEYGRELEHEIVEFDQNFNSTHSRFVTWVKIPLVSTVRDTFFSMYYGNDSIGAQEDSEGTWNENYLAVYHFEESPSETIFDSTSNSYSLISSGFMAAGDLVSGIVTNSIKFDGNDDQLNTSQSISMQDFTISSWFNFDTGDGWHTIFNVDRETSTFRNFGILDNRPIFNDGTTTTFGDSLSETTWYHVVYTYNYDLDELKCYINGVQAGSTTFRLISPISDDFQIGAWGNTNCFDGIIDELRILDSSKSGTWAKAQYANQYSPSDIVSVGVELEHVPPIINNFGIDDSGDGNPIFWADVTDLDSSVSDVMLRYNQTYVLMTKNQSGLWTYHPDISYEEFYTYQIINASDVYGNLATATVERNITLDKDNVNPTILDWEYFADMGSSGTFKANITDTWGKIDTITVNVTYHERMGDLTDLNALMRFDGLQYVNDTIIMISGQIKFTVTATDMKGNIITSTEHSSYVANTAPRVDSVSLSLFENNVTLPIISSSTMRINHTFFDVDGDSESGSLIKWFKWNSTSTLWVLQDAYSNQKSVPKTVLFKGDFWRASYRPKDGIEFGDEVFSENVTIQNSAPYVTNVIIDPGSPKTDYNLFTSYDWFDEDPLDSEASPQIRWYRDNGNGSGFLLLSTYNNQAILSCSVTRKNDDWQYCITPSDGFDNGATIFSNIVTILNTPPTFLNLTINGFNVTKQINDGDSLTAGFTYHDVDNVENSSVDTYNSGLQNIRWYENGVWIESLNDLTIVSESYTDIGEWWQFAINISDGTEYGDWVFSPSVWIETDPNTPPIAENVTITPSNPIAGDTLYIDWDYSDSDEDPESASMYQWYKNGFLQPQFDGLQTLIGADLIKGDVWYAKVRPRDGIDFGEWNVSESVIIGNTPPVVQSDPPPTTFPAFTIYTSNTIIIDYTASDEDNDPITLVSIRWLNDSTEVTSLANSTELPSSMTKKGQIWKYYIRVYDNLNWSIEVLSTSIFISNSNPSVENITLSGGLNTFDNITVSYDYYDVDNDPEDVGQTIITWIIFPTHFPDGIPGIEKNLSYENFEAGYYVYASIVPHDGSSSGDLKYTPYYIIVGNSFPVINCTPNILGPNSSSSFTAVSTLYANYSAYDPDEGIVGYDLNIDENGYVEDAEYRWYRNGVLLSALNDPIVPISYLFRNDNWTFGVRPRDIYGDFGEWKNSTKITIGNSRPEILRFEDVNPIITTEDDLPIKFVYFDYDGDQIDQSEILILWYNNGTLIEDTVNGTILYATRMDGEVHVVIKLSHQYYDKNDNIDVIVRPFDGTDWAEQNKTSHVIRIANSIPTASNIIIKPNGLEELAYADDTLNLTWTFEDLDNDNESRQEMIVRWFRGINEIDTFANWTYVPAEAILRDQTWRAIIQVYDGEDYSLPYYSEPIIVVNSPTIILGVEVSNNVSEIFADQTLLLDPSQDILLIDIDNDPIIDYIIIWYLNNSAQPSFGNETLISSSELMKGDTWYAVIRLYDGFEWSENCTSQTITVINKPPEILEIILVQNEFDDFLIEDENITINVDFYDVDESDSDNSFIRWFVNHGYRAQFDNVRIISSNETNPGDVWICEVTPYDGFESGTLLNFSIHIESRPEISEFNILTKKEQEGVYQFSVKVVDAINNTITSVRYQVFLNGSSSPAVNSILYFPNTTDYWILDFELQDFSLLNTPCIIRVTASSTVEYSDFFNIHGESSYNITLVDGAAPRVIKAVYVFDDVTNPTSIIFIAEVQEFGTGIDKVIVFYTFTPTNLTGGTGASITQEVHEASMEFQNRIGNTFNYSVTVDFPQEQTNIDIYYRIASQDLDGNFNSNAFDNSDLPEQVWSYPPLGLPVWVLYVAAFIIFITFVGSIVYVKFIRKPEVRGLDKDLVMDGVKAFRDEEIMSHLDSHTIGIVVSFFHQAHGPIPIICMPELLRDNWSKLLELSDRSFGGTQFSDDFRSEIVSNYDFLLDRGLRVSVMSFGYSLDRPEARGGQENITENILVHKEIFPLLNQFQEEIQPLVHQTHDLMNREPNEKQKITQTVLKLRKHITAIVLSYENIYGTTELIDKEEED